MICAPKRNDNMVWIMDPPPPLPCVVKGLEMEIG